MKNNNEKNKVELIKELANEMVRQATNDPASVSQSYDEDRVGIEYKISLTENLTLLERELKSLNPTARLEESGGYYFAQVD